MVLMQERMFADKLLHGHHLQFHTNPRYPINWTLKLPKDYVGVLMKILIITNLPLGVQLISESEDLLGHEEGRVGVVPCWAFGTALGVAAG